MFGGNRETGRHKGEPAEDKISSTCTCMCHLNEVETLKKACLILYCPYYDDYRNSIFMKIGFDTNLFNFNNPIFINIVNIFSRQTAYSKHTCYRLDKK